MRLQQNKAKYVFLAEPVPAKRTQGGREFARKGARFERLSFFDSLGRSKMLFRAYPGKNRDTTGIITVQSRVDRTMPLVRVSVSAL